MKMGTDDETVELDGDVMQMSPEDLQDEMSESQPRWILWYFQVNSQPHLSLSQCNSDRKHSRLIPAARKFLKCAAM